MDQPPQSKLWYYANKHNVPEGPVSLEQLIQLRRDGAISSKTLVFRLGATEWEAFEAATAFDEGCDMQFSKSVGSVRKRVEEYRRTCRVCGKIWHSLLDREKVIKNDVKNNQCEGITTCCNPAARIQVQRNIAAQDSEISRLRTCPVCKSANYSEEIVVHDL